MTRIRWFYFSLIFFLIGSIPVEGDFVFPTLGAYARYSEPEFLTFNELIELTKDPDPGRSLSQKLRWLWTTPIISNEAYYRGMRPPERRHPVLGRFLRVGSWNIEKSLE